MQGSFKKEAGINKDLNFPCLLLSSASPNAPRFLGLPVVEKAHKSQTIRAHGYDKKKNVLPQLQFLAFKSIELVAQLGGLFKLKTFGRLDHFLFHFFNQLRNFFLRFI